MHNTILIMLLPIVDDDDASPSGNSGLQISQQAFAGQQQIFAMYMLLLKGKSQYQEQPQNQFQVMFPPQCSTQATEALAQ